jgi:hypothetical protein
MPKVSFMKVAVLIAAVTFCRAKYKDAEKKESLTKSFMI